MRVFEITTKNNEGNVIVKFLDDGGFGGIDFTGINLTKKQIDWFMHNIPVSVDNIGVYAQAKLGVYEVIDSVTFDMFWRRYDDKLNSSRKRTLAKWDKMSVKDRVSAYNFIPKYFANIPTGTRKKYAETYLNSELWNN